MHLPKASSSFAAMVVMSRHSFSFSADRFFERSWTANSPSPCSEEERGGVAGWNKKEFGEDDGGEARRESQDEVDEVEDEDDEAVGVGTGTE